MKRSGVRPSPLFLGLLAVTVAGAVLTLFDESEAALTGGMVLFVLGGWAVSLCLHEFGHAIVAYRGGDHTVKEKGYLTLDIRRYSHPLFSIVLPLVLLAFGGIPLPGGAVWIDHHALRNRRVESLVSLSGPISNLLMGILLTWSVIQFTPPIGLAAALSYLAMLQILAFVLNILPVPGLDGWGTIQPYLPYSAQRFGVKAAVWAPFVLYAVLLGLPTIGGLFFDAAYGVFDLIGGNPYFAYAGQDTFMFWR